MVWIEIHTNLHICLNSTRHHPHGWCGLKFRLVAPFEHGGSKSPPTRVVWIEIIGTRYAGKQIKSPPTRVVWIEIFIQSLVTDNKAVTTHTGGVD